MFKNITVNVLNYPGKKTAWLALKFGDGNEAVATDLGQLLCAGDSINWLYDKTTGTITIKGTGNMPDYSKGTAPWTQYRLVAKKIVVENGITRVGHHSFNGAKIDNKLGYTNVTEIELPEGLTYIGNSAFQYTGASKIDIPSTVTSMGTYAFAYTDTIKSVSFSPAMKKPRSMVTPRMPSSMHPASITQETLQQPLPDRNKTLRLKL